MRVKHGVAYCAQQRERAALRHRYDSIVEGVGLDRISANFERALPLIDDAVHVPDEETIAAARSLLADEGLFVGASSAMHVAAAERVALRLGPGHVVVTVLCDGGQRYLDSLYADEQRQTPDES